ncbi:MAG: DUF2203 domain-containing protein [Candidatus Binataceae bacterium]
MKQADELVPTLEVLIRELQLRAGELRARITELARGDAGITTLQLSEVVALHPELRACASRMAELASKIDSLGCFLMDIDQGLVDFPCEVDDDDVVFLCWQFGEPHVIAWHAVDAGFAQRRPLPGAQKRYLN